MGASILPWVNAYNPGLENVPVEKSAEECMAILNGLTPEDNGEFFDHDGTKIPW